MGRSYLLYFFILVSQPISATRYFVKTDGLDTNGGTTWAAAFKTLQKALAVAGANDEIWVKEGIFYPDEGPGVMNNNASESFTLAEGVALYGSFAGTESMLSQRNILAHPTTLSGEIQQDGMKSNNSHSIVAASSVSSATIFNGFLVENGYNNGRGSAMFISNASPTVAFCKFSNNYTGGGGAVYLEYASQPTISFCLFYEDSTDVGAGAAIHINSCAASISSCAFKGNVANFGGAVYYTDTTGFGYTFFTNCLFSGNKAASGGAIYNGPGNTVFYVNCTMASNHANANGGALRNFQSSPGIVNSILWNNSAGSQVNTFESVTYNLASAPSFSVCIISDAFDNGVWRDTLGLNSGGNFSADPLFVAPVPPASAPTINTGDLTLQECSPGINTGYNAANSQPLDLNANTRVVQSLIDIGAYEHQQSLINMWTAGGDMTHWTDSGNWSLGIVPTGCQDILIPSGMVTISTSEIGLGKTLQVDDNAALDINLGGQIDIHQP